MTNLFQNRSCGGKDYYQYTKKVTSVSAVAGEPPEAAYHICENSKRAESKFLANITMAKTAQKEHSRDRPFLQYHLI